MRTKAVIAATMEYLPERTPVLSLLFLTISAKGPIPPHHLSIVGTWKSEVKKLPLPGSDFWTYWFEKSGVYKGERYLGNKQLNYRVRNDGSYSVNGDTVTLKVTSARSIRNDGHVDSLGGGEKLELSIKWIAPNKFIGSLHIPPESLRPKGSSKIVKIPGKIDTRTFSRV